MKNSILPLILSYALSLFFLIPTSIHGQVIQNAHKALSLKIVPSKSVFWESGEELSLSYIVYNGSDESYRDIQIHTAGSKENKPVFAGDPNGNNVLEPHECWIYTDIDNVDFLSAKYEVVTAAVEAEGPMSKAFSADAALLFHVDTNVEVNILQEEVTQGDTIDVQLVTRLKIDEDMAKNPGTTIITIDTVMIEVQLPQTQWEARDLIMSTTDHNNGLFFDVIEMGPAMGLSLFCEQDGADQGRNEEGILDECEPIQILAPGCQKGDSDPFCKFPEWVFCYRMPIPEDYADSYYYVEATDSFTVWKADEFPAGEGSFQEFENVSEFIETSEYDIDSVMVTEISSSQDVTDVSLRLFPNPAIDELNIDFDRSTTINIQIFNMRGQEVFRINNSMSRQFSLKHLISGTYLVQIETPEYSGALFQQLVIKE